MTLAFTSPPAAHSLRDDPAVLERLVAEGEAGPFAPTAPRISLKMLWEQVKVDVQGKEVQRAATYSYTWLADQVGHICFGIILNFFFTAAVTWIRDLGWLPQWLAWFGQHTLVAGALLAVAAIAIWEYGAYKLEMRGATGPFPLDRWLLRQNALIAAAYMILGVALGWMFHLPAPWVIASIAFIALVAIGLAPFWLRQKIVWQKAGLPYLFRLANAHHDLRQEDADKIFGLVSMQAPPESEPQRVVIAGPVNSGRTSFASGLGTEFAFRSRSVRYLSFDRLIEFASATDLRVKPPSFCDETGPINVSFWPWSGVQVLIIDDISPLLGTAFEADQHGHFEAMLEGRLDSIRDYIRTKHTVWVLGDLDEDQLDRYAATIERFCNAGEEESDNLVKVLLDRERKVMMKGGEAAQRAAMKMK